MIMIIQCRYRRLNGEKMSAYWKDIFREIKNTMGRFFSLLIIAALGTTAVVGIQATSVDMRAIADKTYKEQNLYDIQLKSATGFETDDISALQTLNGVRTVMPTYIYDSFIYFENETRTVRTYALPDELNKIEILDGRLPQNAGECVVERGLFEYGNYIIGDTITLGLDNMDDYYDAIENHEFTIVGIVSSPLYITFERGNTTLGDGKLNFYLYLHQSAYKLEVYTDVYLLMDSSQDMDNLTDDYYDTADEWKQYIKLTGNMRVQIKKDEFSDSQKEIDNGWVEYQDGLKELNDTIAESRRELNDAKTALDDAKVQLEEMQKLYGEEAVADGRAEYYKNYDEYNSAVMTLEAEEINAMKELDEAKAELEEAQEKLDDAPTPEWFYFTRKDGVAFDSYYQDTFRLQSIGYVFPMIFYLVAVLVSLTTMSRMVEEHRTQIGIYKALGYSSVKIIMKYLIYAFSAGAIGGVLGVIIGSNLFPRIIADAYGHLYDIPPVDTPIPIFISLIAVTLSVGIVLIVTLITCIKSMSDTPALLMRPKSPTKGKRVLIEKIPFIWNRLSFFNKVTARNIFRYKKRFIMTLFGVAGCTALLLTAFGLRDSVGSVGSLQYGKIINYTSRAYIKEITTEEQRAELDSLLSGDYLYIHEESFTAKTVSGNYSVSLIVPEMAEQLNRYINLHSHKTGESVPLMSSSVLVTEKLARESNVSTGDSFEMMASDGKIYTMKITGIVENYVQHYVYMSPDIYKALFDEELLFNSILAVTDNHVAFAEKLLTNENVRAVVSTKAIKTNIVDSTDALGIVTIVLIILACALAFVVLFNLTNINITERIRELATIKVLGFYDSELAMYIYRENGVVTFLGIALGIALGIQLLSFVLNAAELDLLMFPHIINATSYILSIALSIAFAAFVNAAMNYKLFKIDMVESLKNVE